MAYRLYLGARAIAYGETGVVFQGPFPKHLQLKDKELSIVYSQELAVLELSEDIFEVWCSCGPLLMAIWQSHLLYNL